MVDPGPGPAQTTEERPSQAESAGAMLEDWITIWQSEMAGLILDREMQETALRLVDGWAAQARAAARLIAPALDAARRHAGSAASTGAAPAAAPDGRDAVIAQLLDRVAELERRLSRLDAS